MNPRLALRLAQLALLVAGGAANALPPEDEARLKALEFALTQADRAQQSVHTRFQMLTEIRRAESEQHRVAIPEAGVASPPRDYEELVRLRGENEQHARRHTDELQRLYARFDEIEREKDRLRDEIRRLMESR